MHTTPVCSCTTTHVFGCTLERSFITRIRWWDRYFAHLVQREGVHRQAQRQLRAGFPERGNALQQRRGQAARLRRCQMRQRDVQQRAHGLVVGVYHVCACRVRPGFHRHLGAAHVALAGARGGRLLCGSCFGRKQAYHSTLLITCMHQTHSALEQSFITL